MYGTILEQQLEVVDRTAHMRLAEIAHLCIELHYLRLRDGDQVMDVFFADKATADSMRKMVDDWLAFWKHHWRLQCEDWLVEMDEIVPDEYDPSIEEFTELQGRWRAWKDAQASAEAGPSSISTPSRSSAKKRKVSEAEAGPSSSKRSRRK